jgi:glycosyltransferase involved in cell wall biosynthesis
MRILIISQYYYPEPVEKIHDLARGLVRRNHDVQVITGFPCYPAGKVYSGYRQKIGFDEELDGVRIARVPQIPDHSRSAAMRIVYYISFAVSAAIAGLANYRSADVVLVYQAALPVGLSGWLIRRLCGIPLIIDVVDLWPESVVASGMLTNRFAIRLIRQIAGLIYRMADHINVVTHGYKRCLLDMGISNEKISVIHNWMPTSTYQIARPQSDLARREGMADCFNVIYAGTMGPVQGLQTVLDAAPLLNDLPKVQFVLIGDGLEYEHLLRIAKERNLQNVLFLGRRLPQEMPRYYALGDVLLVHLKPDPLSDISIPSKTFAYMASGRPVLMAVQGDAQEFITENDFGIAIEPSNPQKMADAVRWFYSLSFEERNRMGEVARNAYLKKYCSEVQISKFERVLTDASKNKGF